MKAKKKKCQSIWAASCMCAQGRRRSESSLSTWRKLGSLATHWAHSEDSDQTGGMPRLIWVFAWRTVILLVLSWGGSFIQAFPLPLNRNYRQSKSVAVLSYWSNRNRFPKTNKRKTVIDRTWNTAKRKSICWMDGWVRVLRPFNSISVVSGRWKGEDERLCAMERRLGSGRISPTAGFEPTTPWSEVGSANRSATRTLQAVLESS